MRDVRGRRQVEDGQRYVGMVAAAAGGSDVSRQLYSRLLLEAASEAAFQFGQDKQ